MYGTVPPSPPAYFYPEGEDKEEEEEEAPAYSEDGELSRRSSSAIANDDHASTRDALFDVRRDVLARGGMEGLPDTFHDVDADSRSIETGDSSTGVLEARGSSEGRAPSFPL